ncbi:hypothetical protein DFH09DRAFT_929712, partial [Mycena vulgaris]
MAHAQKLSDGSSLKRKRETTAGGSVVTQTSYTTGGKTAAAKSSSTPHGMPSQWHRILDQIAGDDGAIPPPSVLSKFVELHTACLNDFRTSQTALQKASATSSKFGLNSSNDAIPSSVSNNLKLPHTQLIKVAAGADLDDRVAVARVAAEKEIATASIEATKYLGTLYSVQVEYCRKHVDVPAVADGFAAALQAYSTSIITSAGGPDTTVWNTVISRLKAATVAELQNLNYEFVASLEKEAEVKEAKANAVSTARADAEMTDATKPIGELTEGSRDSEEACRKLEGEEKSGSFKRRRRHRPQRKRRAPEGKEAEGEEDRGAGERLGFLKIPSLPSLDVTSWVSPSDKRFHHHCPDTYPESFFAASPASRSKFVLGRMSELYFDTRLRNRSFHNMTDVPLSHEQIKTLSLNQKF